jgi:hypothetical protein
LGWTIGEDVGEAKQRWREVRAVGDEDYTKCELEHFDAAENKTIARWTDDKAMQTTTNEWRARDDGRKEWETIEVKGDD